MGTTIRTTIYSRRFGNDHFEVISVTFGGVREKQGFNRSVFTTRHEYRLNGNRTSKLNWLAIRDAAKERAT